MLTTGPMCRYSKDLDVMLDVLIADNREKLIDFTNVSHLNSFIH